MVFAAIEDFCSEKKWLHITALKLIVKGRCNFLSHYQIYGFCSKKKSLLTLTHLQQHFSLQYILTFALLLQISQCESVYPFYLFFGYTNGAESQSAQASLASTYCRCKIDFFFFSGHNGNLFIMHFNLFRAFFFVCFKYE